MSGYFREEFLHVLKLPEPVRSRRLAAHLLADGLLHGVLRGLHGEFINGE